MSPKITNWYEFHKNKREPIIWINNNTLRILKPLLRVLTRIGITYKLNTRSTSRPTTSRLTFSKHFESRRRSTRKKQTSSVVSFRPSRRTGGTNNTIPYRNRTNCRAAEVGDTKAAGAGARETKRSSTGGVGTTAAGGQYKLTFSQWLTLPLGNKMNSTWYRNIFLQIYNKIPTLVPLFILQNNFPLRYKDSSDTWHDVLVEAAINNRVKVKQKEDGRVQFIHDFDNAIKEGRVGLHDYHSDLTGSNDFVHLNDRHILRLMLCVPMTFSSCNTVVDENGIVGTPQLGTHVCKIKWMKVRYIGQHHLPNSEDIISVTDWKDNTTFIFKTFHDDEYSDYSWTFKLFHTNQRLLACKHLTVRLQQKHGDNTSEVAIIPTQIQDITEDSIRYVKHNMDCSDTIKGEFTIMSAQGQILNKQLFYAYFKKSTHKLYKLFVTGSNPRTVVILKVGTMESIGNEFKNYQIVHSRIDDCKIKNVYVPKIYNQSPHLQNGNELTVRFSESEEETLQLPLSLVEKDKAYLLMEYVPHPTLVDILCNMPITGRMHKACENAEEVEKQWLSLVTESDDIVRTLEHQCMIYHGDLHMGNLMAYHTTSRWALVYFDFDTNFRDIKTDTNRDQLIFILKDRIELYNHIIHESANGATLANKLILYSTNKSLSTTSIDQLQTDLKLIESSTNEKDLQELLLRYDTHEIFKQLFKLKDRVEHPDNRYKLYSELRLSHLLLLSRVRNAKDKVSYFSMWPELNATEILIQLDCVFNAPAVNDLIKALNTYECAQEHVLYKEWSQEVKRISKHK